LNGPNGKTSNGPSGKPAVTIDASRESNKTHSNAPRFVRLPITAAWTVPARHNPIRPSLLPARRDSSIRNIRVRGSSGQKLAVLREMPSNEPCCYAGERDDARFKRSVAENWTKVGSS
jgi:hypothetical protein